MTDESTVEETIEVKSFSDTLKSQLDEFYETQQGVIASLNDGLAEVAKNGMSPETSALPEVFNYGKPPFFIIVDDGDPLLLLDEEYKCYPLPPFFELEDECMSDDYNMVYSTPITGDGMSILRFIPANPDYEFPVFYADDAQEIDAELFNVCDEAYEKFINGVQLLSKEKIARHLFRIQDSHRETALGLVERFGEFGLEYNDILRFAVSSGPMMEVFSLQTIASSQRIIELMEMETEEEDE